MCRVSGNKYPAGKYPYILDWETIHSHGDGNTGNAKYPNKGAMFFIGYRTSPFHQVSIKLLKTAFVTFHQSLESLLYSCFPNSYHLTAAAVKTLFHMKHAIHSTLEQHSLQKLRANLKLSVWMKEADVVRCIPTLSTSNSCVTLNRWISIICWSYLDAEVAATVKGGHRNLRLARQPKK